MSVSCMYLPIIASLLACVPKNSVATCTDHCLPLSVYLDFKYIQHYDATFPTATVSVATCLHVCMDYQHLLAFILRVKYLDSR